MRVAVTGASGGLGGALIAACAIQHSAWECIGITRASADLTQPAAVEVALVSRRPDVIIHCASMTAVDQCETDPELAHAVNVGGTEAVARAAKKTGARLVFISTDYVFDGKKSSPYTVDDRPNPQSVYGRMKLEGERITAEIRGSLIARTSWLYGRSGKSFPATILRLASSQKELRIVDDQTGAPTYSHDMADAVLKLVEKRADGIFHIANSGSCTWFEFAKEILALRKVGGVEVIPITTAELNRPAQRPANSRLDCSRYEAVAGAPMRHWREALADALTGMAV